MASQERKVYSSLKSKFVNKKLLVKIVALCLVSFALGAVFVEAQGGTTFTISVGNYPGAPTYTVFQNAGTYYAKDAYGSTYTSSADGYTLLTTLLASVTTGEGVNINFKDGEFLFSHGVPITTMYVHIAGEGNSVTTLKYAAGASLVTNEALLNFTGKGEIGFLVSDLTLDGNKASNTHGAGLYAGRTFDNATSDVPQQRSTIRYVVAANFVEDGFDFQAACEGLIVESNTASHNNGYGFYIGSSDHTMSKNVAEHNGLDGFVMIGSNIMFEENKGYGNTLAGLYMTNPTCQANQILNCQFQDNVRQGILLYGGTGTSGVPNHNTLYGNICDRNSYGAANTYSGIRLDNVTDNIVTNSISTNTLGFSATQSNGIELTQSDYANVITNNIVTGNINAGIYVTGSYFLNNTIRNNIGFKTESTAIVTGTSPITWDPDLFNNVTPTSAWAIPSGTATTIANVTCYLDSGLCAIYWAGGGTRTFSASAEYQPQP